MAPLAADERIRLAPNLGGGHDWHILADRQRLKQVLLNLLSNAVKYNRRGGAVAISYGEAPEGRLRINVTDTGPGIAPEKIERLFTPFERVGAKQTIIQGTGLGLVLSKRLVEAMHGTLGVESTAGRGSTFWVELPLIAAPETVEVKGVEVAGSPAREGASARLVLYIEDNLSNLKLVQRALARRPDVRLLPAMQGRLGLDLAREHRPHLILLDLHLPDIRGEEVLLRLQATPETREIPVVIISADAMRRRVDSVLAAGARAYLTKPIDVRELLKLIDQVR